MPTVTFTPAQVSIEVDPGTKILVAARKVAVPIRYGCAACRCGTCAVQISGSAQITPMEADERELLQKIGLSTEGDTRLSCRARIEDGLAVVDLAFQNTYSPDVGENYGF